MSHTEWEVDHSDPNPSLTLDEVRKLEEFVRRPACDFRVDPDTGRWQVYGAFGRWMDTDIPARITGKPFVP